MASYFFHYSEINTNFEKKKHKENPGGSRLKDCCQNSLGSPGGSMIKKPLGNAGDTKGAGSDSWVKKIPYRRKWLATPYSCLENQMDT